jgi:hypothetical protein
MALRSAVSAADASRLFARPAQALALLRAAWPIAVGVEIARRSDVLSLEGGTLTVRVPDARWRRTLHRMQGTLLARLRRTAGALAPRRIGFLEGYVPGRPPEPGEPVEALPEPLPPGLAETARSLSDPEIREAFERSAALYLTRSGRRARSGRQAPPPGGERPRHPEER